jgi:hypothetical protein
MAICNAISGITFTCSSNTGGVQKIYLANFEDVTGYTESNSVVTQINMAAGATFHEFQFNRNTSSINEEATINLENGTTFYTQTITLVIPKREAAKRDKILVLADGQPKLAVIVLDQNGLYWFAGLQNGAYLTANVTGSGVQKTDANGYNLTITGEEPKLAPEVDSTIIPGLL